MPQEDTQDSPSPIERWRGRQEQQVIDIKESVERGHHEIQRLAEKHTEAMEKISGKIEVLQTSMQAQVTKLELGLQNLVTRWVMVSGFVVFVLSVLAAFIVNYAANHMVK